MRYVSNVYMYVVIIDVIFLNYIANPNEFEKSMSATSENLQSNDRNLPVFVWKIES